MMLENEKRQLEAKLKHSRNREEVLEREKETVMHDAYASEERIRSFEVERAEKEKIIRELRLQQEETLQMARDLDMQSTMYDKLQQQLIDEKMINQNLAAETKATEKRAEILAKTKEENAELNSTINKLQNDLARREHAIQVAQNNVVEANRNNQNDKAFQRMKNEVNARDNELVTLRSKFDELKRSLAEAERNADQISSGVSSDEIESLKKQNIEIQVERDQLKQEKLESQKRFQESNSNTHRRH